MSIADCRATRRKRACDPRWKPKRGFRAPRSQRAAETRNRKRIAAGQAAGSIGGNSKGKGKS